MKLRSMAAIAATALMACTMAQAENYLVIGSAKSTNLGAAIEAAGGTVVASYPFGVAVASSADTGFSVPGLTVVPDVGFDVERPAVQIVADFGFPPSSGDDDFLFDLQWGHNYVGATNAWNNGVRGAGVLVAVLDGGFDLDHPDLAPNIIGSANMTPQGPPDGSYACENPNDPFSHGTHTAGTVAAADNGFGTIGVAPEADLLLVKVLEDVSDDPGNPATSCGGSGDFAGIIAGIYFATVNDADIISMSLGGVIPRIGNKGANSLISAFRKAVSQAITYAHQNGVTVITSAGNAATDLDGGDRSAVRFNNGLPNTVGISALAPQNWATYPDQDIGVASYTNYGTSMVDFGAPGGGYDYPGNENCVLAGLLRPCWVLDFVFSTGNNSWYWSVGTSMAAPHAAGVAALIISETGNSNPAHVMRELHNRAVDGGKPGRDDFFGHGITHSGYQ